MTDILSQPLVAIIFLLGVLVLIHELGHFLIGKLFGIGVEVFSIGFGPKILSFKHRNTLYQIAWIPLGGYVKFAGAIPSEEVPEEFQGTEFYKAPRYGQIATILAGPIANLLLAIFIFAFLGSQGIEHPAPIIGQVRHGSPAEQAGLQSGDKILEIGSEAIFTWHDIEEQISQKAGTPIEIKVLREGGEFSFQVTPRAIMAEDMMGKMVEKGRIGIGYGFHPAILQVKEASSPAAESGIESGMLVKFVRFENESFEIKSWDEFLNSLKEAFQRNVSSLSVELSPFESEEVLSRELKTELWKTLPNVDFKDLKFKRTLANSLGIANSELTIQSVQEPSNLSLKPGDQILAIENEKLADIYALSDFLQNNEKESILIRVLRNGKKLNLETTLEAMDVQKASGKEQVYTLPLEFLGALVPPPPVVEKYSGPLASLSFGVETTLDYSRRIFEVVGGLFMGDVPLKVLGGPIMIAKVAEESVKQGLDRFFNAMALISINLGIINLFPIPALDGGKFLMVSVEAVLRRRLKPSTVENFHILGFMMILSLVVLSTYNDLSRFWSSILQSLSDVFK